MMKRYLSGGLRPWTIMGALMFLTTSYGSIAQGKTVWLDELDLTKAQSGWRETQRNLSCNGNPISIGGQAFDRGIGTHAESIFRIDLNGGSEKFTAFVGVDDEAGPSRGSVEFIVYGNMKVLWKSEVMRGGDPAKKVEVDTKGIGTLILVVTNGGDGIRRDHADWADAQFEVTGKSPEALAPAAQEPYILTPKPARKPRINGPKVFGARPGAPFLYTIPVTGDRPMKYSAKGLPKGLKLDAKKGMITGSVADKGEYKVTLSAENALGKAKRDFRIVVGDKICLTPPMGWNSWNCWAGAVDDAKVRSSADAMVKSGLTNHGWAYINIDDCWEIRQGSDDPMLTGEPRDEEGKINCNKKFPDMAALCEYVHKLGLKIGIYSSPGPYTCAGFTASYEHENQDAQSFADWGFDYLKYDWCSYDRIAKDRSLAELKKPYEVMRAALDKVHRDIVYSLCQYGMGDVPTWGADVGGNCWRTTGDINDSWSSMSGIGFSQDRWKEFAGPGHWNDPDMLVVGKVGWGPNLHPTGLTPDEQYTHISLWVLLAAPLLIGCDLADIDEFTISLLTNDEVLEVDQDPLGRAAGRITQNGDLEVWAKEMEDGSKAVGLFNRGLFEADVEIGWSDLGVKGPERVRDLWRQKDLGVFEEGFKSTVPSHGVVLVKVSPAAKNRL